MRKVFLFIIMLVLFAFSVQAVYLEHGIAMTSGNAATNPEGVRFNVSFNDITIRNVTVSPLSECNRTIIRYALNNSLVAYSDSSVGKNLSYSNGVLLTKDTGYNILCDEEGSSYTSRQVDAVGFPYITSGGNFTVGLNGNATGAGHENAKLWNIIGLHTGEAEGTPSYIAPTPADATHNSSQVIINISCSSGTGTLWFDNLTSPSTKVIDAQATPASYTTSVVIEGTYYYVASCNAGITNTSTRTWVYDGTIPTITLNPSNYFNTTNGTADKTNEILLINYTAQDNIQLFATEVNVSLNGLTYFSYINTSLTGLTNTTVLNLSMGSWPNGIYDVTMYVSDAHTSSRIRDYQYTETLTELTFDTAEGNNIRIKSLRNADWTVEKQVDRYSFNFAPYEIDALGKYKFQIYCDNGLDYIENSIYDGHFVCYNPDNKGGNWIDFEGADAPVVVTDEGEGWYEIEVEFEGNDITFNSIGGLNINQYDYQFELARYLLDDCSAYTTMALNFSIFDEDSLAALNASVVGTFEILNNDLNVGNVTVNHANVFNFSLCITPSTAVYQINAYLQYGAEKNERYYIVNATINNNTQNVYLYNFDGDSGLSELNAIAYNYYYVYYTNVIGKLQRYYPGENVWRTIQIDKADDSGDLLYYVYQNDRDYKIVWELNNVVLDTTEPMKFICDSTTECEQAFTIEAGETADSYEGMTYTYSYNNDTGITSLTWSDTNNIVTSVRMLVEQITGDNINTICDTTTASASGTILCNVSGYNGLITVKGIRTASPDDPFFIVEILKTINKLHQALASQGMQNDGILLSFLIMATAAGFGAVSPIATVIITIAGGVFIFMLGLASFWTWTFLIGAITLGIIVAYMVKK